MRPYYIHIRPTNVQTNCKGGVTVAVVGNEDDGYTYGVARCSAIDNYDKSKGRSLATGRVFEKKTQMHFPDDIRSMKQAESHIRQLFTTV